MQSLLLNHKINIRFVIMLNLIGIYLYIVKTFIVFFLFIFKSYNNQIKSITMSIDCH